METTASTSCKLDASKIYMVYAAWSHRAMLNIATISCEDIKKTLFISVVRVSWTKDLHAVTLKSPSLSHPSRVPCANDLQLHVH